jgi:hypothetical protein
MKSGIPSQKVKLNDASQSQFPFRGRARFRKPYSFMLVMTVLTLVRGQSAGLPGSFGHRRFEVWARVQNGKCERTLEMAPKQADVAALIAECNQAPHLGSLTSKGEEKWDTRLLWNDARHRWTPGVDPTWTVDGVSTLLS